MDVPRRNKLLENLQKLAHKEAENVDPIRSFLPLPVHRQALHPQTVIVRGGGGAGKSALFGLLRRSGGTSGIKSLLQADEIPEGIWLDCFSQASPEHPSVEELDSLGSQCNSGDLRTFWMAHLARRVQEAGGVAVAFRRELRPVLHDAIQDRRSWLEYAMENVPLLASYLDAVEKTLVESDRYLFASYDHLDRIGTYAPDVRRRCISSLLAMWLSFSNRYRRLRAKIFLRDDLLDPEYLQFPDATQMRARSVSLEWTVEDLYRALVRQGVAISEELCNWFHGIRGLSLFPRGEFGLIPGPMPESTQKSLVRSLAGEVMGKGVQKGYTYRWIPSHLQDANGRIVPRSLLSLIGFAAESARNRGLDGSAHLLSPIDLRSALERTSRERVAELHEDFPLVGRFENLRGSAVLMDRDEVIRKLAQPLPGEGGGQPDGELILEELLRLGLLKWRGDGQIDVPDIYRYGYGIKRVGGVARPR